MSVESIWTSMALTGGTSFLLGIVLTPMVIGLARRAGLVARPRADRWSVRPTALMGGTAIFGAFAGSLALTGRPFPELVVPLAAGGLIFLVGLVDDLRSLRPQHKLLAQVAAACILVAGGVHFGVNGGGALAWLVTILFVVGITNALNLLDNMDGLAAGVASVAALVIAAGAVLAGSGPAAVAASALAGATLSFLVFNFHPARVFMGDCGSMFLGLMLAALSIQASIAASTAAAWAVLFPCVALAVPIFDTTFVTVMRKMNGRAVSQGGCDHTSHRLVRLGLSEPQAVLLLCGVALVTGALGVAAMRFHMPMLLVVGALAAAWLLMLGRLLARVEVYSAEETSARPAEVVVFAQRLHKKQTATALADVLLAFAAAVLAVEASGSGDTPAARWQVALLVGGSAAGLALAGVYRGVWRHLSLAAFLRLTAGCVLGAFFSLAAGLATEMAPGSGLAALNAGILLLLLSGSRGFYLVLSRLLPAPEGWVLVAPPGLDGEGADAVARARGLTGTPAGVLTLDVEALPRSLTELERLLSETRPGAVLVASPLLRESVEEVCRRKGVRCFSPEETRG